MTDGRSIRYHISHHTNKRNVAMRFVKKSDVRKGEIIQAAKELYLEKDFSSSTMKDVMNKLNIAKGTIYHYFTSKDELLEQVIDSMVNDYMIFIEDNMKGSNDSVFEKIIRLFQVAGSYQRESKQLVENLHKQGNITLHTKLIAKVTLSLAPKLAEIIQEGIKEKTFLNDTPLETAELIIGGMQFLTDTGIHDWSSNVVKRRSKALPSMLDQLLSAKPGTFSALLKRLK